MINKLLNSIPAIVIYAYILAYVLFEKLEIDKLLINFLRWVI